MSECCQLALGKTRLEGRMTLFFFLLSLFFLSDFLFLPKHFHVLCVSPPTILRQARRDITLFKINYSCISSLCSYV